MMEFLLGLAGAAAIYAVILVNKWHLLRQFDRVLKRVDDAEVAIEAHPCKQPLHDSVLRDVAADCNRKFDALPRFGICAICKKVGFADCMTKMTAREYANLRGKTGDPNEFLMEDYRVHIHDECLRRAGYVHEYGVVAGWRKVAAKKGKG